ncbi:MAG: polysaccharide biosynthesis tyrosine autokinase, partial [Chitinivibrionales bacterium]|nr:polysaccharide biosynthesis tyrosine autokinase [Chitinivibrionales bacterium]MBD3357934.1 polysaccharide biosynthesis tyrosine autokinase [Chitinivibrionales bacterium]
MDTRRPRKFKLGEIIHRMNEGEAQSAHPRGQHRPDNTAAGTTEAQQASVSGHQEADTTLPRQPRFGPSPSPDPHPNYAHTSIAPTAPSPTAAIHSVHPGAGNPTNAGPAAFQPAASTHEGEEEEEFDLFRYIGVILRRKEIIVAVVIIAGLFSIFSYLKAPRYYTAKARVLFRPNRGDILDQGSDWVYWRDREKDFNTHLELLKSNVVLRRVIEEFDGTVSVEGIREGLTISQGETNGEKNDIIELSYRHADDETARDVLNRLCKTYIDYRREVNAQEDTRFIFKLETQIDKLQSQLSVKENALREFKEANRMVRLSSDANVLVSKLAEMELSLQKTQLDLLETKERMNGLRSQIGRQEVNVVQSMTYENPFQSRLAELELQLSTLSAEYSPDHYKIKTITQQIEQIKQSMGSEITEQAVSQTFVKNPIRESLLETLVNQSIRISSLEARRTAQEQIIEKLNSGLKALPSLELRYAYLQRETESLLETLRMLKTRYEEAKIRRDSKETDLKILELATRPINAISSKKPSSVLAGVFVGIVLGIALAFLLEYLDQTLKDPNDIERGLELPLIGLVPLIDAEESLMGDNRKMLKTVLEPFRAVRANLKHLGASHRAKVFMMCSAVKGEGKTTLAANLALTFAMDDKKVILIDADLRRSQIHQLLNVPKETGLSDYLIGEKDLAEIIKPTHHDNLFVITSGERPHNPAELLGTRKFDELVHDIRSHADIIFFDSPALLPVSDTITMAPKMDGCVMVMRALWTPLKAARQAKSQLSRIGTKLMGGLFNGVSHSRGYYPYYYGYYGYYSYRYSYEDETKPHSIREFGLRVENGAKELLRTATVTVPRAVGLSASFLKHVLRRKTFWLLAGILALLTAAGIVLESRRPHENQEWVEKVAPSATTARRSSPIAIVESTPESTSAGYAVPASPSTPKPSPSNSDSTVKLWIEAVNDGALYRYLAFYDRESFRYPDGGYAAWAAAARKKLLREPVRERIIEVESINGKKVRNGYRQTQLDAVVSVAGDTSRVRYV